ncbi:CHAT domain-containing protein [Aquimarina algiphila]|uniref:CHAT domain-containing protein n=1 Tax=Aquimarina algiphila TaxID=2047982 RepID=UPI00232D16C3|nr:CHAT domain-containing protein [Aquimarina algiphila]
MNYTISLVLFILFRTSLVCYAQEPQDFNQILNADIDIELKEQKIDSFFKRNAPILSALETSDYYRQFGLWYFRNWNKNKNKTLLRKAILYTKKSKENRSHLDNISLSKISYNLGVFNSKNSDFFAAIDNFNEVTEICTNERKVISTYVALGEAHQKISDFHKALKNIEKGIEFSIVRNINYQKKIVDGYLQMADIYSLMGYKEYATEIQLNIEKADSILNLVLYDKSGQKNRIYQIEGNRLLKTGKYSEAAIFFFKVLENLHPNDSINRAITHNSIGVVFLRLKKYEKAMIHLQKSILYHPKLTLPYENLGDLYIAKEEFDKGLYQYQKAIHYAVSNDNEVKYDDLISKEKLELAVNKYYLLHHLIQKANGWMHYYDYDQGKNHLIQALKTFKQADELVDIIRFESTAYKSKLFWREQGASLYMKAVETCYLLQKPEEAYYFMEKNKALLLLEDITNEQAKENAKLPVTIAKREFTLKQAIYLSENELNHSTTNPKDSLQLIKDKVYRNKRIYEKFIDSISHVYPIYAANKKKITVLPYSTFNATYISEEEVVVQYILNKNQGYGLLTSIAGSVFFEIKDVPILQKNVLSLLKKSSQPLLNQEELDMYHKNANAIFQQIIPQEVYDVVKGKKLTILPDHTLQQISFDGLTTSIQEHSYFIKDTEIRYAYSMSYLDRKNQFLHYPKYSFMGFAPVTFTIKELGDLRFSKEEVISISDMFEGNTLVGEKATKSNFLDTINQYGIVHLSTHADVGDGTDPWIAFNDEKLSLNEIYATKNQSDMVVLSACKTSLGELKQGEGVMSLARGFFHSGAKSVVSSLWTANDKSSKELMIDFYKEIDRGATKASALRNAKLNYINTHNGSELSPFYWGALILIGDNTPLSLSSGGFDWYWIWIGLFVIVILVVSVFYVRRKR